MMIAGIILAVLGLGSAIYGVTYLNSLEGQLTSAFSDSLNPGYIWIIAGVVVLAIGIVLLVKAKKK